MTDLQDKVDAAVVERVAAALGLELGPQDGCSCWAEPYRPNIRWPDDYSESERTKLRSAARAAMKAAGVL